MNKNLIFRVLGSIILVLIGFACDRGENNNSNNNNNGNNGNNGKVFSIKDNLKYLAITDAKSLFIARPETTSKSTGVTRQTLFKITTEGAVVEVSYRDSANNVISSQQILPEKVLNLTEDYILVIFNSIDGSQNKPQLMVRKSDGAAFDATNMPAPSPDDYYYRKYFGRTQHDGNGNIYFKGNNNGMSELIKVNISNPRNLVASRYSAAGESVWSFFVDNAGNMAYNQRYRSADIGFVNNPYGFVGTDGNNDSIITAYLKNEPIRDYLQFATISGNPFKLMPYGDSLKVNAISIPTPQGDVLYARFKNTKKAYCLMCGQIIECWNPQRKLKTTPLMQLGFTPYRSEEFMVNTDHFMYILGYSSPGLNVPDKLVQYNPESGSSKEIKIVSGYELYQIEPMDNDKLLVYALRLSDGNRVLLEVSAEGEVSVQRVLDNEVITSMERIN